MNVQNQVDTILNMTSEGLTEHARQARETKEYNKIASAHIHFLVKSFAQVFLTPEQEKQVKAILDLHDRCLFPLLFASQEERTSTNLPSVSPEKHQRCSFCPEGEHNEIGHDFYGEPCKINGVPCCEVCAIGNDL